MSKILLPFIFFLSASISMAQVEEDWKINFTLLGTIELPGYSYCLDVYGNYAYIGDGWDGHFSIVDVSNPLKPKQVGVFVCNDGMEDVCVVFPYAYIANGLGGFRVLDIFDPRNPIEVGSLDIDGYVDGVYVKGKYAYVVTRTKKVGLWILDISNPRQPKQIGFIGDFVSSHQVYVSGNYAYVADGHGGLRIIDVSNPRSPKQVGILDIPSSGYDVSVNGNYAYVSDGDGGGIRVIDISDPRKPIEVGHDSAYTYAIHTFGKYVYSIGGGIMVFDPSNPIKPEFVGYYYNYPDWNVKNIIVRDIFVNSNGYAYVTIGQAGFCVLSINELLVIQSEGSLVTTWGNIKQRK